MPACGPLAVTAQPPFAAAALKARDSASVRHWITVAPGQQAFYGLPNAHIVERAGRLAVGLIGIDRRELWVYLDPTDPVAPVVRLGLAGTAKLLYAFWRLVPEEDLAQGTVRERLAVGRSPVDPPCPRCKGALWPTTGRHGAYLTCTTTGCGYTKSLTPGDATLLAQLMGITCARCGGAVQGRRGGTGIFLGCTAYPACTWTQALETLV